MGGRQVSVTTTLVLDTATHSPVVAIADQSGALLGARQWRSRHRHSEELLQHIDGLLSRVGVSRKALGALIVGTGPGSFTGLRIGLATAKVIAYSLDVPLVGVSTTLALAHASRQEGPVAVSLPAGATDRYVHVVSSNGDQAPALVAPGESFATAVAGAHLVAVDIESDDIPAEAADRGRAALEGLAAALARLGADMLAAGQRDDPAQLVPAYVALPRGIARAAAEMEWSPDLR